jgi:hypothetical protein
MALSFLYRLVRRVVDFVLVHRIDDLAKDAASCSATSWPFCAVRGHDPDSAGPTAHSSPPCGAAEQRGPARQAEPRSENSWGGLAIPRRMSRCVTSTPRSSVTGRSQRGSTCLCERLGLPGPNLSRPSSQSSANRKDYCTLVARQPGRDPSVKLNMRHTRRSELESEGGLQPASVGSNPVHLIVYKVEPPVGTVLIG